MATVKTVVRNRDSKKRLIPGVARRMLVKRVFQDIVLDDIEREAEKVVSFFLNGSGVAR